MQVGTTIDQGLYNKPSAAVHPGVLAAGTLPQYNTIQYNILPSLYSDTHRNLKTCYDGMEVLYVSPNSLSSHCLGVSDYETKTKSDWKSPM